MNGCLLGGLVAAAVASTAASRDLFETRFAAPEFRSSRRLYVSPGGSDTNDGLSPERAFRTISRAAEVVEPGDLVLVSGGTYFEHVHLERAGTREHPIVFRAVPGETALVTFGDRPQEWRKVKGTRFTYALDYDYLPDYVWEDRTVGRYVEVTDPATLEYMPGSYLYDREDRVLYVHALRGSTPDEAAVIVVRNVVAPNPAKSGARAPYVWDKGFWFRAPHNRVEGFMICYQPIGMQVRTDDCEARNNTVYGCVDGITTYKGARGVIAGNSCYRNYKHGILIQGQTDVRVVNNVCRANEPTDHFKGNTGGGGHPFNVALYGKVTDVAFMGNTVIANDRRRVWRFKSAYGNVVTTHNVLVGGNGWITWGSKADYSHNTVVGGVLRSRHSDRSLVTAEFAGQHNAVANNHLYVKNGAERDAGFADPGRHDYRLRRDSPHLGRGALPDAAPLHYVSPAGSDRADGRTPGTAWRTIGKAASAAAPGDTVYIMPGTYAESTTIVLQGTEEAPITFKSHGRGLVVLDGGGREDVGIILEDAAHVTVDGLVLRGFKDCSVRIEGGRDIALVENVLDGAEAGVRVKGARRVSLVNNTLCRCGKGVEAAGIEERLVLRNNLFTGVRSAPTVLDQETARVAISERNAFSGALARAWLAAWRKQVAERHDSLYTGEEITAPDYLLPTGSALAFGGIGHRPIGARGAAPDTSPVVIEDFRPASLFPTRAILAWRTPYEYPGARLSWTSSDGKTGKLSVAQQDMLKETVLRGRLTDLAPGTRYDVTLEVTAPDGRKGSAKVTFQTPRAVRPPATLHVSPSGTDENDGRSAERPFRTLTAASLAAVPGDTVLAAPGVYPELLRIFCSGFSPQRRLTFRSAKPGGAVIDCETFRPGAVHLGDVRHVTFDGFRIRGLRYASLVNTVHLENVEDFLFVNNIFEENPDRHCTSQLFRANGCRDLVIRNNLFANGFQNLTAYNSDNVTVERNTFYRAGINAVILGGKEDAHWRIVGNIFMDITSPAKVHPAVKIQRPSRHITCDRNLYWRTERSPKMKVFGFMPWNNPEDAVTIAEAQERFGFERHGAFADPMLVDPDKGDFRLKPGSPAIGMGQNGRAVGMDVSVLSPAAN